MQPSESPPPKVSSSKSSPSPSSAPRTSRILIDGEPTSIGTLSLDDSNNTTDPHPALSLQHTPETSEKHKDADADPLVMQIVVRRDLLDAEDWGVGPLMAQAAHAATAVLHETRTRPETIMYLSDLKNMRKVVLQTADLPSLLKLSSLLSTPTSASSSNSASTSALTSTAQTTHTISHYLWTEQPENVPTCLALAPNRREKPVCRALDKAKCRLWR